MDIEILRIKLISLWKQLVAGLVVGLLLVGLFVLRGRIGSFFTQKSVLGSVNVAVPTIVNGELVLPQITVAPGNNKDNLGMSGRVGVVSANLIPVFDSSQKLTGLRIIGEMQNGGDKTVSELSPYVRFLDTDGRVVGQKIGTLTSGFDLFGLLPQEKTYYDVTVDNPPTSDRLEVVLNVASSTGSAVFDELKIATRSVEIKNATYQGSASDSGGQNIQYYTVNGTMLNTLTDPVSEISVYAWIKDSGGKVFSFARQDYKNDLISPGNSLDFKLNLLPLKTDETYDSYEVAVWGKRYKLGL